MKDFQVHIIADPGEEIDDQIVIWTLMCTLSGSSKQKTVCYLTAGNMTSEDRYNYLKPFIDHAKTIK